MHSIFDDYLMLLARGHRNARTLINNRQAFERLERWLEPRNMDAAAVTRVEMLEFAHHLLERGSMNGGPLAPTTVQRHLIHLRAAYSYAIEIGHVALNPTAGISKVLPRVPEREPEILSAKQMRCVLDHFKSVRERLSFYVISLSGLRRHEWLSLGWERTVVQPSFVDFENEQFVVLGKGGRHRVIPMHAILVDMLGRHRSTRLGSDSNFVIESTRRGPLSDRVFNQEFRALYNRAGLQSVAKPTHILRKTLTTNLTRQGVRPDVIEAIMGWSGVGVRARFYTGRVSADAREAIATAYRDEPVFPEQARSKEQPGSDASEAGELELLRLKLRVAQLERENLEIALRLEEKRSQAVAFQAAN